MNGGLPQPPGGFDPYGPQFQEDPNRQQQLAALPSPPPQQPVAPPVGLPDASGQTLGQVQQLQAPSGNPMVDEFKQYVDTLMPMVQQAQRQHMSETSRPGVLANILTWGGASIAHRQKEAAYNQGVDDYNQQLKLYAMEQAKDLVNEHQKAQALGVQSQLGWARLSLAQQEAAAKMQALVDKSARETINDYTKTLAGPPTPMQMRAAAARNQKYVPDAIVPNKFNLVPMSGALEKQPDGSWGLGGEGAAPGSPAAALAGPGAAEKPQTDVDRLNQQEVDLANQKAAGRAQTDTAATRTRAETAPQVINLVRDARAALDVAAKRGIGIGGGASRGRALWTKLGGSDPTFVTYRNTVKYMNSLLMSMHTGSRSSEMLMKSFTEAADPTTQPVDNMKAALATIEKYAQEVIAAKGGSTKQDEEGPIGAATQATAPTQGESAAPSAPIGVTPGGRRWRVVE